MNTPAPTPIAMALEILREDMRAMVECHAHPDTGVIPPDEPEAREAYDRYCEAINGLEALSAALSSPAPAQAAPSAQQIVAWHVHFPGCDGTADWVELGSEAPDVSGWAGAVALPLVHAQSPQAAPLLQDADRALSKALAATPEAYRRPKAAPSAVPEGYAVVPVEPTPLMLSALQAQTIAPAAPGREVWAAMLAAAPVPAAPVVAAPSE